MIYNTGQNQYGVYGFSPRGAGTSAGAPQWAGLIAVANQGRALVGLSPLDGYSQTLPTIDQHGGDFHDITSGNNGYNGTRGYCAGAGWDRVTGIGTPMGVQLVGDLAFHAVTSSGNTPSIHMSMSSNPAPVFTAMSTPAALVTSASPAQGPVTPVHDVVASPESPRTAVVAMPLEALALAGAGRRRHVLFDAAIESLLSDRSLLSAS